MCLSSGTATPSESSTPPGVFGAFTISDGVYHLNATIAGIAVVLGLAGVRYRRIVNRRMFQSTSRSDRVMYTFLSSAILTGFFATFSLQVFGGPHGYDIRETISPWLRQLLIFNAQPELVVDVPWEFKAHVLAGFTLNAVWPWTRLVHASSVPVGYVSRPYVVYPHDTAPHA